MSLLLFGFGFTMFTQIAKRRIGVGRQFYRLSLPWAVVSLSTVVVFAFLIDRHYLSTPFEFIPTVLSVGLALTEWIRWRAAVRDGTAKMPVSNEITNAIAHRQF